MKRYLLDTNVLSETTKPRCDAGVRAFLDGLPDAFISVLSIHEIAYGLERLPTGKRRTDLNHVIEALLGTFSESILPVDQPEARAAGALRAAAQARGRVVDTADGLIAGTALVHGLTIVTRNENDLSGLGVLVHNPWSDNTRP